MKGLKNEHYFSGFEPVCILADKVFAHYKQRISFDKVKIPLPSDGDYFFEDIIFKPGQIIDESLVITSMKYRPNFKRVKFRCRIPFILKIKNVDTAAIINISNELPEISKDVILFMPESRDEFELKIIIETASQLLSHPIKENSSLVFDVGVLVIIKVVGKVQLLIPEFGFCPEPPECENYRSDSLIEK